MRTNVKKFSVAVAAVSALGGYLGGRTSEPIGKVPDISG